MKKLLLVLLVLLMVFGLAGCSPEKKPADGAEDPIAKYGSDTLEVMNWGIYIGEDVVKNFEEKFNVHVNYTEYESNEMLYTKIADNGAYDVVVPADYMLDRMIKEDMLLPLDYSYMTNVEYINKESMDLIDQIDENHVYSLPYFVATAGIVYDKNKVSLEDLEKEGWSILKDTRYAGDIYMYDSERDAFMIALKDLGYSANTENMDEINEAYEWLVDLHETMNPSYVTDEVIDNTINVKTRKALAIVYSGDAAYILSEDDSLGYYIPDSGSRIAVDGLVIPKTSKNPKLANEFINFMFEYESALDNSLTVGYTSTDNRVLAELSGEGGDYEGNEAYLIDLKHPNSELFKDNLTMRNNLTELWLKVKFR